MSIVEKNAVVNTTTAANREQVALAAASKVVEKEFSRDAIAGGEAAKVDLSIVGVIDGEVVLNRQYACVLSVRHDSVRGSSATPNQSQLIACILAKLNSATRDKILRELPEEFAANGNELPAVDDAAVAAADAMLKRLRAKREQKVRGSVVVNYTHTNG